MELGLGYRAVGLGLRGALCAAFGCSRWLGHRSLDQMPSNFFWHTEKETDFGYREQEGENEELRERRKRKYDVVSREKRRRRRRLGGKPKFGGNTTAHLAELGQSAHLNSLFSFSFFFSWKKGVASYCCVVLLYPSPNSKMEEYNELGVLCFKLSLQTWKLQTSP